MIQYFCLCFLSEDPHFVSLLQKHSFRVFKTSMHFSRPMVKSDIKCLILHTCSEKRNQGNYLINKNE